MRRWALGAWMLLCWPAAPGDAREAEGPELWARRLREGQVEAIEVLWREVPSRTLLEAALRSPEKKVRVAGAIRAGETGALWAVDLLRELAGGRSPGVAMASRLALRQLGLGGGDRPLRSVVWPGSDPDQETRKGGRVEWTFVSRDGALAVRRHLEEAARDLGWRQDRDLAPEEIPPRCRNPFGGVFFREVYQATLSVCGGDLPGQMATLRVSVPAPQEDQARALLGILPATLDRR